VKRLKLFGAFLLVMSVSFAAAQTPPASPTPPAIAAKDADVESLDAIVKALYDVISGSAGKKRDWDRMRSLFAPEGRMGLTGKRADGTVVKRLFTVDEYITANAKPMEEGGFFESEAARHVDQFGQMAQVFSTYEARRLQSDTRPFMRGINSLLLWNDGKRWWILSIFWQAEGPGNPLPEKFLKSDGGE